LLRRECHNCWSCFDTKDKAMGQFKMVPMEPADVFGSARLSLKPEQSCTVRSHTKYRLSASMTLGA
jgi:polyferredoxin